jgi:hypothetical protein
MAIDMRDGKVLAASPETIVGYTNSEVGGPPENRPSR